MPLAETMRPRSIGTSSSLAPGACARTKASKRARLVGRNVEEIERRRLGRQFGGELPAQIAVDLDHGDQQRDAEAERQHDGRRQRAGPVDIGDRHAQHGRARARRVAGERHQQRGDQPQRDEHAGGDADIDDGDAPVVGERDGERDQRDHRGGGQRDIDFARPARLRRHRVAEQRADRHVMGAAERPEREGERRQQPVDQRQHQFGRMQRRHDRQRNDRAEGPGDHERQHRAEHHADGAADRRQHQHLRQIDREHAPAAKRRAPSWWR